MTNIAGDVVKKIRIVLFETFSSFGKHNNLSAASSLAFSATLALIPSLFLVTFMMGAVIGSSARALAKTQDMLTQVIPAYSQNIIREVQFISSHVGAISVLNGLVLLWSVTPLIADLRLSLGKIFRKKPTRPFLLEKLIDVAIGIFFLLGLSAIAIAGFLLTLIQRRGQLHLTLTYLERVGPFLFVTLVVFSLYYMFSKRVRLLHLLAGAVSTTVLWFTMRPAFHLFLLYNPGYGFAFGSFKSLFVVIIWIYFSLALLLFGAELAASMGRDETVYLKKLMEGKRNVPVGVINKYVVKYTQGDTIFMDGDPGDEMFSVLKGKVAIMKGEKETAVITPGRCFGGMSFFLGSLRVARAVALQDVELVTISNENINNLMNEFPEFVVEILREMAERLRETNKVVD
jgi:membrane protein